MPSYNAQQLAHKSAHHLHSIPPREKSTRTLILDHIMWQHGRARFAQARAELGMKVYSDAEEEGDDSEGENVDVLGYRSTGGQRGSGGTCDTARGRALRARAEGHEKVLSAMLEQPPDVLLFDDDDLVPRTPALPNGVRLRLALASLVNDFFARDDDPPSAPLPLRVYPTSIALLALTSTPVPATPAPPVLPPFSSILKQNTPPSIFNAVPRGLGPEAPWAFAGTLNPPAASSSSATTASPHPPPFFPQQAPAMPEWPRLNAPPRPATPQVRRPQGRALTLYNHGAGETPVMHCARHLTPCNCSPPPYGSQISRHVGAGLRRPSLAPLRRSATPTPTQQPAQPKASTARLADLLPRFLRLSALVAIELGREAESFSAVSSSRGTATGDTTDSATSAVTSPDASDGEGDGAPPPTPARPSRNWYALLAALATRASLEGYLARGWRGADAAETLLGLGVALPHCSPHQSSDFSSTSPEPMDVELEEEGAEAFEPDGWPGMEEAARVLFPGAYFAQEEYEIEMRDRYEQFMNVPQGTPDLRAHLTEVAGRYPPEPLERAALRFCEAVSRWRGKPELETQTHTRRIRGLSTASHTTSSASVSISALIHPPAPPIEKFFALPSRADRERKRRFGGPVAGGGRRRKERRERGERGWVDAEEWIGPYGIPYGGS